jgi:predicted RNase H-like HicB family nuclease
MKNRKVNNVTIRISKPRHYKPGEAYSCRFLLYLENGGYSAYCLGLPEVVSHAATGEETMAKVIEAFRQTVLRYRAAKQPIPWIPWDQVEVPDLPGAKELHPTVLFDVAGHE